LQNQSYDAAGALKSSGQLQDASAMAGQAGMGGLNASYTYSPYQAGQANAPQLQNFQMSSPGNVNEQQISGANLGGPSLYSGQSFTGPQNVYANQVGTSSFTTPGMASAYMNPYLQSSLAPQMALLGQQQGAQNQVNAAQATQAGAFGNSRFGVQNAQQNQANQLAMSNLVGQGYNQAYNTAQGQFNTEQGMGLQAQQANQSAALQAGLANQNMGYNTALQNAQLAQQQQLANQSLQGQYGLTQGQFNQAANLANQQTNLQAQLANQNMGYNVGNTNLQAMLGVQNLGAGQNMQAQLANQGANQSAANLNAQQGQFGANFGLQGLNTALQSANTLGTLGNNQYNQNLGIIGLQNQLGGQQQQQVQNQMNVDQQNALNAQNFPYQQMNFMSNLIRGLPMTQQSASIYQAPPSTLSQVAGLGLTAAGLGAFRSNAKGGAIKKSNGLMDLALKKMEPENV
jgi:hypothetical protein